MKINNSNPKNHKFLPIIFTNKLKIDNLLSPFYLIKHFILIRNIKPLNLINFHILSI